MSGLASDFLNPALLALIVRETVLGYEQEADAGLPWPLAYLAAPLVLHEPTRIVLPQRTSTHLPNWAREHELLVAGLPGRARSLRAPVDQAVRLGLRHEVLGLSQGDLTPGPAQLLRKATGTIAQMHRSARLVGRWFAKCASPATPFAILRVRP